MTKGLALLLVSAGLMTGCGSSTAQLDSGSPPSTKASSAAQPQARCVAQPGVIREPMSLVDLISPLHGRTWAEIIRVDWAKSAPPKALRAITPDTITKPVACSREKADTAQQAKRAGALVLVQAAAGTAVTVVAMSKQGDAAVSVNPCTDPQYSAQLQRFLERRSSATGASASSVLLRLAAGDRDTTAALAESLTAQPTPWSDLPADHRQLNTEDTPRATLDQLTPLDVKFQIPDAWWGLSANICTKSSMGWNTCVSLTRRIDGPITTTAYAVPGESLSVWLKDPDTYDKRLRHVGDIASSSSEKSGEVSLVGDSTVTRAELESIFTGISPERSIFSQKS
jgi:hypothetical protein